MILEINPQFLSQCQMTCTTWFDLLLVVIVSCLLISIALVYGTQMVCIS